MNSDQSVQALTDRLNRVSAQLAQVEQGGSSDSLASIIQELGQMGSDIQSAQSAASPDRSEQVRTELVHCRMVLHEMMSRIEQLRTTSAERYREALGEEKDAFEQLDEARQQSRSPEGYRHRQAFYQLDQLSQQIHQLDGSLLDAGYQMGRSQLAPSAGEAVETDAYTVGTEDDTGLYS
ncbi:hypothetical protein GNP94_18155 [Paenibacillus campinasensis]|uniref:Uncharacterized protein n=1 Tax=Paenibacillus campinasensis TaxID=66347 RepID=A0ABW9T3P1_9BACL|nr:hypothetical protein [Paenibacillus campinasensis]MUG67914.1 hypothetical protein [Paenibacillus campinasensis]